MKKKIKNVLITGAGKRIGSSIAKSLAANNWNIALHYNSSEKETKKLSIELQETYNVKTVCIQANLSDLKQLKKIRLYQLNIHFFQSGRRIPLLEMNIFHRH